MAAVACNLVEGSAEFNEEGADAFGEASGLQTAGTAYATVAIMGPQSSGKSTLLNAVFGTSFVEMDASAGRSQTTKGVWVAKSPKFDEKHMTLVLDLEGSDGRERGEDDTNFEKQTALFALAVADVLLINLWCHDIGREHGSGKPLLRTVMQVNLRLFNPRKMTLLFVIRDRSPMTPLDKLAKLLKDDLEDIWQGVAANAAPPALTGPGEAGAGRGSKLDDYFDVRFTSLPNYEERPEEFAAEAVVMRKLFNPECSECLYTWPPAVSSGEGSGRIPGDAFFYSASKIWEVVKSNKDLDLPAHRIMVATVRCDELVNDCVTALEFDEVWKCLLQRSADADGAGEDGDAAAIGALAAHAMWHQIASYSANAAHLDAGVVQAKRDELLRRLADEALPHASAELVRLRARVLARFATDIAKLPDETFGDGLANAVDAARKSYDAGAAAVLPAARHLVGAARSAVAASSAPAGVALPDDVAALLENDAAGLARELEAAPGAAAAAADDEARFVELAAEAFGDAAERAFDEALSDAADKALRERVDAVYRVQGRDALRRELGEPVMSILDECDVADMWRAIRGVRSSSVEATAASLRDVLELQLGAPEELVQECIERLEEEGAEVVHGKCLDVSAAVASRARERFTHAFNHTADGTPVVWSNLRVNVTARAQAARLACAKMVAAYAILDLDGTNEGALKASCEAMEALAKSMARAAAVESASEEAASEGGSGAAETDETVPDAPPAVFASVTWPDLAAPTDQLLSPTKCRQIFKQCLSDTSYLVSQALATQDVARRASSTLPPMWAIVAMLVLGFDEFVAVVYNPLWLIVMIFFAWVVFRLYNELEVERELRNGGAFLGGMAIANKIPAVVKSMMDDSLEALRQFGEAAREHEHNEPTAVAASASAVDADRVPDPADGDGAVRNAVSGESLRERRRA